MDVTYDVRQLSPTIAKHPERWLRANRSQADKIADEVRLNPRVNPFAISSTTHLRRIHEHRMFSP